MRRITAWYLRDETPFSSVLELVINKLDYPLSAVDWSTITVTRFCISEQMVTPAQIEDRHRRIGSNLDAAEISREAFQ